MSILSLIFRHVGRRAARPVSSSNQSRIAPWRSTRGSRRASRLTSLERLEDRLLLTGTLGVDKLADVATVGHGGTVQYSYNVTFTPSGVPADPTAASGASISVIDNVCGAATSNTSGGFNVGDTNPQNGNLNSGETWSYRCTFVVPAHAAGETDPIVNSATVTGNDTNGGPAASGMDTASVNILHGGTISGRKFNDVNGNGSGTGDPGRNGVTITLFRDANGNGTLETATDTLVSSQPTATSVGQDGRYTFGDLAPATYFVQETVPAGSTQTAPPSPGIYTVIIATDESVTDRDFGNFVNITISGHKFLDLNNNGELDDDEPGLEDWQIFLDTDGDGLLDVGERNTLTDEDGDYSFTNLGPGTYTVREILQAGWRRTSDNPAAITASGGQNVTGIDFGNLPIGDAILVENPETGETDLLVTGTIEADRIFVRPGHPAGTVDVHINDATTESFQPTGRIIVQSFEGDDLVSISRHIELSAVIDVGDGNDIARGGSGDDILMGQDGDDRLRGRPGDDLLRAGDGEDRVRAGRGNDIVLGEDGDDHVRGAVGRDLLIGGEGADQLRGDGKGCDGDEDSDNGGQKNQDIMIGGTTDYDDTDEALQAIMAEWTSARSYEVRVDNLRDGTGSADGENDDFFLDPTTVFDDDDVDRLHGCGGRDWFFALQDGDTSDRLLDRHGQEFVDELT